MANRQTLKNLITSTIFDNLLRKITAPKHQELELQIMDSVVTKEDDIVNDFSSEAADKVASAGSVKKLNDTTLKTGRFQTITTWLNQSNIPEGDYDVTFENAGQNLFGYNHFKLSVRYLNLGTEYIQLLQTFDGRSFRRSNVLNVYDDFEEVTVGEGGGITSVVAGTNVTIDKTDPKNPIINVPITNGDDGLSAYEIAVANGFVGTEAQWLASLQGAAGTSAPTTISIFKTGTGTALPQKFKWPSNITVTSVQLLSNCTEISVTIGSTTYNHTTLVGVTLPAGTELLINDITVANGQTNANALIIF